MSTIHHAISIAILPATVLLAVAALVSIRATSQDAFTQPVFDYHIIDHNRLEFPANYREWIFLSAGRGMTYGPSANSNGPPRFDNVFVNPGAYREFLKSGRWPAGAIFVLEVRNAVTEGSINKGGQFQKELVGIEVEIKDRRFTETDGWGFFEFGPDQKPAKQVAKGESCYTCHSTHGAVEQTFVQFYPTLIPIAEKHGTLKPRP